MNGSARCYRHGGATPKGVASPHFVDGRKSLYLRHLPRAMGAAYKAALADPDYTCLRGELALQTARLDDLLAQLAREEGPAWTTLVLALDLLQLARSKGEVIDAALATLDGLIRSGAACARTRTELWGEVRALMVEKGRLAAAESKRLADLHGTITVEQALLFGRALLSAAAEVVTDRDQLRRLQQRALALLPPAEDDGPVAAPAVVVDNVMSPGPPAANGHPPGPSAPGPAPGPASSSLPGAAGAQPAPADPPPAAAPTPPPPGPVCGLRELPEGADPDDWEWVPDENGEATTGH
jgi:hypothetical protein